MRSWLLTGLVALGSLVGTGRLVAQKNRPRLLVFFTIDQMRPDYFDRFSGQFHHGLGRLLKNGAFFTNAFQDHGITETAPGHASTMSGRFPRSTGITRNLLGVNDTTTPLLGAPNDPGASPRRFRGTTVTDWLIAKDSRTRALSVSMKDRAAILPIGRSKQDVYWYALNGIYTTSTWYRDTLPSWVQRFNARRVPMSAAGKTWTLLLPDSAYSEPDTVKFEFDRKDVTFPHTYPTDSATLTSNFRFYPMMDQLSLDFALEGLNQLDLGRGPETDVLAISLSSTDLVGHLWGPDSREQHDQIVRLDRALESFIDSLYKLRDSSSIIFALTADHGVTPIPEISAGRYETTPVRMPIAKVMGPIRAVLRAAGADTGAVDFESGALFIDRDRLAGSRLGVDQVVDSFVRSVRTVPNVMRVDRFRDLAARDTSTDAISRRWLHMFPPELAPDVVVALTPGSIWSYGLPATHGSPRDEDAHVPILFMGRPFRPGRYGQFARTVDIAPTLAKVLGVTPTERLDGRPLKAALK